MGEAFPMMILKDGELVFIETGSQLPLGVSFSIVQMSISKETYHIAERMYQMGQNGGEPTPAPKKPKKNRETRRDMVGSAAAMDADVE